MGSDHIGKICVHVMHAKQSSNTVLAPALQWRVTTNTCTQTHNRPYTVLALALAHTAQLESNSRNLRLYMVENYHIAGLFPWLTSGTCTYYFGEFQYKFHLEGKPFAFLGVLGLPFSSRNHRYRPELNPCKQRQCSYKHAVM